MSATPRNETRIFYFVRLQRKRFFKSQNKRNRKKGQGERFFDSKEEAEVGA